MGESSPDEIYEPEFARHNIWARVRQTYYMGDARQIKSVGASLPDKIYGQEFFR